MYNIYQCTSVSVSATLVPSFVSVQVGDFHKLSEEQDEDAAEGEVRKNDDIHDDNGNDKINDKVSKQARGDKSRYVLCLTRPSISSSWHFFILCVVNMVK